MNDPDHSVLAPTTRPRERARLLLAFSWGGSSTEYLQTAVRYAGLFRAELHVVRTISKDPSTDRLFPNPALLEATRTERRLANAARETRALLSTAIRRDHPRARLHVRSGSFVEETARCASELGATLIVVPTERRRMGSTVTAVVRRTGIPVLLTRSGAHDSVIVGATTLKHAGYPILRAAAALSARLKSQLVVVHNVKPVAIVVCPGLPWGKAIFPGPAETQTHQRHLSRASRRFSRKSNPVIATEINPVDAILREARRQNAEVLVVGERSTGAQFSGRVPKGVASQVVNRAVQSVLVAPLDVGPDRRSPFDPERTRRHQRSGSGGR